jgi:hypothetical protein
MEMATTHPTKQIFNIDPNPYGYNHPMCGGYGGGGAWGNDMFSILLLFALFGGGFGGGWGNRFGGMNGPLGADLAATTAESVAYTKAGLDFAGQGIAGLGTKLDSALTNQCQNTAAIQSSLCQGFSDLSNVTQAGFYNLNTSILTNKYDLVRAIDNCCCNTQQSIAALNANLDKSTCAIINAGKDNTQAILSALCNHWQEKAQMKICDLQRQLSEANIIGALKNA